MSKKIILTGRLLGVCLALAVEWHAMVTGTLALAHRTTTSHHRTSQWSKAEVYLEFESNPQIQCVVMKLFATPAGTKWLHLKSSLLLPLFPQFLTHLLTCCFSSDTEGEESSQWTDKSTNGPKHNRDEAKRGGGGRWLSSQALQLCGLRQGACMCALRWL